VSLLILIFNKNNYLGWLVYCALRHFQQYVSIDLYDYLILVFNATFSNISAISWQPVLVVAEAGVPGENH